MKRPDYEALDTQGFPYIRAARVVGELPTPEERGAALQAATVEISDRLQLKAQKEICFGTPVHLAFGMTRQQAKNHPQAELLLKKGDEVPLDFCPLYERASS